MHPSTYRNPAEQSKNQQQQQQKHQQQQQQDIQPTASTEQTTCSYPLKSPMSGSGDRKKLSIDGVASLSRLHKHKKRIKENFLNSTPSTTFQFQFQSLPPTVEAAAVATTQQESVSPLSDSDSQSSFCRHCVRPIDEIQRRYQNRFEYYDCCSNNNEASRISGNSKSESNLDKTKSNCLALGVGNNFSDRPHPHHTTTMTRKEYHLNAGTTATAAATSGILKNKYFSNNNNGSNNNLVLSSSTTSTMTTMTSMTSTTTAVTSVTTAATMSVVGTEEPQQQAQGNSQAQLDARPQAPDSPSLVKVRSWYTMSKQGVSC